MIPGIDVSHWQREIDWSEVKRSGVKFAFIKATEFPDKKTSLFIDDQMRKNITGASANGILWSAYHFFRTHIDPVIQAKVFCETVGSFSSLPPVLDLEVAGSRGERLNYKVRQFLDEVERITRMRPIIYSSGGFWRSYMTCEKRSHADWARAYPLWVAQYTSLWPTPLYPWAGWDFWQYSDKGKIPGVITHVDLNWFNGSVEDLQRRFVKSNNAPAFTTETFVDDQPGTVVNNAKTRHNISPIPLSGFHGDYQEPSLQQSPDRNHKHRGSKTITGQVNNKDASPQKEEEWIKRFFLQNA